MRRKWTRSRPRFRATHKGRDVFKQPTLSSGIKVGNIEFDYAMAAQWWGFKSLAQFQIELDEAEQAHNVAVYRTKHQIDAVLAYEQHRKSKQAAARKPAKGKR